MSNSIFLFDDRNYFTYGEVCSQSEVVSAAYVAVVTRSQQERKRPKLAFEKFKAAMSGTILSAVVLLSSATPFKLPNSILSGKQRTTYEAEGLPINKKLTSSFIQAKDFLGLKQTEIAQLTGISKSTIEKIDQGVYPALGDQVAKQMLPLIELCNLMKEHFGERKFIARSKLRTPDSLLGDISPLDYALNNGPDGILEIISLERKSFG